MDEKELLEAGWKKADDGYKHPPVKGRADHQYLSEDGRYEIASLERIHTLEEADRIQRLETEEKARRQAATEAKAVSASSEKG